MTPQLRFPEFTDEWQVKKLGSIASKVSERNSASSANTVLTNSAVYGVIPQTDFFDKEIAVQGNLSNYYKTALDDFVYNPRISTSAPVGPFKRNNYGSGVLSPLYNLYRFRDGQVLAFFEQYLKSIHWHKYMKDVANYGARSDRMAISSSDLLALPLPYPSKPEQEKIADFLTAVDERIGVSEKKLGLLEAYKRGVMQKIFSQQIRFKDENGSSYPDWEEKKLSDVLKERNTQTPISGEYPLMAFVAYKGVAPKGDRYNREFLVSDAKSKKYKQTQLGDFIYSSNNLETGSIGLNLYGSASISPVYSIFETKDGYSHQFLGAYLTRKKFIYQMVRYRQGVVYGQWRIHESEFLKIEEKFPCTGEQQKIADFLTTLDARIAAEKSKLTAAKKWKKGLLQRMFV